MTTTGAPRRFLSGVILAAGGSVRMGRPKQLLPLRGRALLQHALDSAAAAELDEIVLVLGHAADTIRSAVRLPRRIPVQVIVNQAWRAGQSTSLRAGLHSTDARSVAAVVLLADQPGVPSLLIGHVIETFLASGRLAARPVWHPARGGRVPGHPVVLARGAWAAMDEVRGDEGARAVLAAHPDWLLEVAIAGEPPRDIDDEDDYRQALDAAGHA